MDWSKRRVDSARRCADWIRRCAGWVSRSADSLQRAVHWLRQRPARLQGRIRNIVSTDRLDRAEAWLADRFNERAIELVRGIPATRVLDIGCGDGRLIHHVVKNNPEVTAVAIDDDDSGIREQWDRLSGARLKFQAAHVCQLPFDDNAFAIVTAFSVLEHIDDPDSALREIRRVSNGWLIASVPLERWWRVANIVRRRHLRRLGRPPDPINRFTRRSFRQLLERHGHIEYLGRTPMWCFARVRLPDDPA